MKKWILFFVIVLGSCTVGYAQIEEMEGDFEETHMLLETLIGGQLRQLSTRLQQHQALEARLENQVVASVDFQKASFEDVIEWFREISQELDRNKEEINVVLDPEVMEKVKGKKITLRLKRVPLSVVLRYAMQQFGLVYELDAYAVLIYPIRASSEKSKENPGSLLVPNR